MHRSSAFARIAVLLLIATSQEVHAASLSCASLKPLLKSSHIPDAAVAVFRRGGEKEIFCTSSLRTLSPDATFEAASLSKPIFAFGVLKLVQEGRLDLDRPLTAYLDHPYEHQQDPFGSGATPGPVDQVLNPRFSLITARMVLSHSSGLPNWSHRGPLLLRTPPGEKWSYSGEGYVFLQHVVEAITHQPIESFLEKNVLMPLGMVHSSFIWRPEFAATALAAHSKSGHAEPIQQYARPVVSSTLYTTLGDYSRFVSELLEPALDLPLDLERQKQISVRSDLHVTWGLGVAIEEAANSAYFHWGANPGFQSFFMCDPKAGRGVLFLTDSDNGLNLVDTLVHAALPGSHPALRLPMIHPKD